MKDGGRGLKSLKDVCENTKVRVACYMAYQDNPWIEASWENEMHKEGKSLCRDVNDILTEYGVNMKIGDDWVWEEEQVMFGTWDNV